MLQEDINPDAILQTIKEALSEAQRAEEPLPAELTSDIDAVINHRVLQVGTFLLLSSSNWSSQSLGLDA